MPHPIYQFGEFTIDPAARELWHGAQRISLPPKSFDCLAYLLDNRERAVGRDELISAVWGRVDVSDAVLAQTLRRARLAVGDTGAEQTTIRTVPRFGYRWIAGLQVSQGESVAVSTHDARTEFSPTETIEVEQPEAISTFDDPSHETNVEAQPPVITGKHVSWIVRYGIAVLVLIAIVIGVWRWQAKQEHLPAGEAVVVMPVTVGTTDAESSWIRLGAMDYIAARLREDGKLAVLPSSQVVALIDGLGGEEASAHVAQATGAKWMIQPSAQQTPHGWELRLVVRGNGITREAAATAASPLAAAEQASERLLTALDVPHASTTKATPGALTESIQRVDAALLAGDVKEAKRLIDAAPLDQRNDPALRVREGQLEFRLGHLDEAERIFAPIANATTPLPVDVQSQAMMGLGAVAVRRGDFPLAEKRYAEALASLGDHGDANLVGNAYNGRGVARGAQGQYDLALSDLGRARVARERAGNRLDAASVDVNLANIENARHRYSEAIAHFDQAIAVHERYGVNDDLAADLLGRAHAQLQLLDVEGALASSTRAFKLVAGMENRFLIRAVDLAYAQSLLAVGRLKEAATVVADLPDVGGGESGEPQLIAAEVALAAGDSGKALDALRSPVTSAPEKHFNLLPVFVEAALREQQATLAQQVLDGIHEEPADADDRMALDLARARLAAGQNETTEAERNYVAALTLADQSGVPAARARVGSDYGRFLIGQHQLDKASSQVGDLAAYADKDFSVAATTVALYHALGDTALENAARDHAKPIAGERAL